MPRPITGGINVTLFIGNAQEIQEQWNEKIQTYLFIINRKLDNVFISVCGFWWLNWVTSYFCSWILVIVDAELWIILQKWEKGWDPISSSLDIIWSIWSSLMSFLYLCWINALEVFLCKGSADLYKLRWNTGLKSCLKLFHLNYFYAKPKFFKNVINLLII